MDINTIITDISDLFNVSKSEIFSSTRKRIVADARASICYILHRKLKMSSTDVGKRLGLSHTTVLHACKNCDVWIDDSRVNPMGTEIINTICEKYGL